MQPIPVLFLAVVSVPYPAVMWGTWVQPPPTRGLGLMQSGLTQPIPVVRLEPTEAFFETGLRHPGLVCSMCWYVPCVGHSGGLSCSFF